MSNDYTYFSIACTMMGTFMGLGYHGIGAPTTIKNGIARVFLGGSIGLSGSIIGGSIYRYIHDKLLDDDEEDWI